MTKRIGVKLSLMIILCGLIIAGVVGVVAIQYATVQAEILLGEKAVSIAIAAACGIDEEDFKSVIDEKDINSPEFKRIYGNLSNAAGDSGAKYLYTFINHSDTEIEYVVDGSGSLDRDDVQGPGELDDKVNFDSGVYTIIEDSKPIYGKISDSDVYGALISAYAPIRTDGGEVIGYIGCDISAEVYNAIRGDLIEKIAKVAVVALLIVCIVFVFIIRALIINPIVAMSRYADRLRDLDLTVDVDKKYLRKKDEIGRLANSFNEISITFRGMVEKISKSTTALQKASTGLSDSSAEISNISEGIAGAVSELSQGAAHQAGETEKGSHSMSNLGDLIHLNIGMIRDAMDSSHAVDKSVVSGLSTIDKLTGTNEKNTRSSDEILGIVRETELNSRKISNASNVIASLASQTNLLAINAAIEAAHAGESGKGFGVIAENVRKLAVDSAQSADSINSIVNDLIRSASYAVEKMEEINKLVREQSENVTDTKTKFNEISVAINHTNEIFEVVTDKCAIMTEEKEVVLHMISSLANIARENATSTEDVSSNIEEQTAQLSEISREAGRLSTIAEELSREISRFRF